VLRPSARQCIAKLPLAVILLSGAFLRFHALGAWSLKWDELLVPMAARHSLAYIFNLCSSQETHPPLFYLLTKAVLLVSSGDVALRFLSALSGTVAIYLLYRLAREFIDEDVALTAAAFLTLNLPHLVLSRALRPYSLQTALFVVVWWLVARLIKDGRRRDFILLCCFNFVLLWLHYFAYYFVAAQGVVLAAGLFVKSSPVTFKQFALFCAFIAATAIPIYIWFVLPSLAHQLAGVHLPRSTVLDSIGTRLRTACAFVVLGPAWADFLFLLPLAGCVAFVFRKPKFAGLSLTLGIIPLALVLAMAPGYPLQIWHVVWITPLLSLCAAMALSRLPGRKVVAPLLAATGAAFILIHQHDAYYTAPSGETSTDFKATAERLAPVFASGALIADAAVPGFLNVVSWYLDQSPRNPLTTQDLEPGDAPVALHFLSGFILDGQHAEAQPYVREIMGEQGKAVQARNATVHIVQLDRKIVAPIDALPASFVFSSNPKDFYGHVFRMHNARSVPAYREPSQFVALAGFRDMEDGITATQNDQPAFFEFVLKNTLGDTPIQFAGDLHSVNQGAGNWIRLFVRFDEEQPQLLAESTGPDARRMLPFSFLRQKPFRYCLFHVEMYCSDSTARFHGDNLRTLLFRRLSLALSKGGTEPLQPSPGMTRPKTGG